LNRKAFLKSRWELIDPWEPIWNMMRQLGVFVKKRRVLAKEIGIVDRAD
jgi:hypothetical protein